MKETNGLPIPTLINKSTTGPVRKNNKPTKNVNLSDFIFSEKVTKQKQVCAYIHRCGRGFGPPT